MSVKSVEVISPAVASFTFAKPNYSNLTQALTMYVLPAHEYSGLSSEKLAAATGILSAPAVQAQIHRPAMGLGPGHRSRPQRPLLVRPAGLETLRFAW
jgi:hypothetical protein